MPISPTGSALVHDVWEETAPMAFAEISAMLKNGAEFVIGLDSEFAVRDGKFGCSIVCFSTCCVSMIEEHID